MASSAQGPQVCRPGTTLLGGSPLLSWGHVTALCPRPPFCPRLPPPCPCSRTALVSVRSPRHCPECPVRLGPLPSARSPVRTSLGCRHPQRRVQDKRGGSPVPSLGLPAPQLPSPESFTSALHAPPGASLCSPYSVLCNRAAGRGGRREGRQAGLSPPPSGSGSPGCTSQSPLQPGTHTTQVGAPC